MSFALELMLKHATTNAEVAHREYVTPEQVVLSLLEISDFDSLFPGADIEEFRSHLVDYLEKYIPLKPEPQPEEEQPDGAEYSENSENSEHSESAENSEDSDEDSEEFNENMLELSAQLVACLMAAAENANNAGCEEVEVTHLICAIASLEDSVAAQVLLGYSDNSIAQLMRNVIKVFDSTPKETSDDEDDDEKPSSHPRRIKYTILLNKAIAHHNPVIGREEELARTIQVLCRKDKNNPVHVGEAGVGKTAIAYGLAAMIERGEVPPQLRGCHIYQLDMGGLTAGTEYRGEFENRINGVLNAIARDGNAILYIDDIHTVVGAGKAGGGLDASNLLKSALDNGGVRIMGATTFEEYNRTFGAQSAFARRFEKIDIKEPSVKECEQIIQGIIDSYSCFHEVDYAPEAIAYAVEGSARYISGRYLPDKAIDVIDEAGAWLATHPELASADGRKVVDRKLVADVLAKICHVESLAEKESDTERLADLDLRIKKQIYGQDKAVNELVEAVQMSMVGLSEDNKPVASLLFVGPTGVGKTEVTKVLAHELNLPLVRFDMSEYAEKHTVAKLIGSPAGYVGYEDGGLLTDAVRNTPNCVLLFDEIEKAHPDIYNILLQVMDYAVLSDNKGRKTDFRHVIFIMTANAGAQNARQGSTGFVSNASAGSLMMKSVKQTFKPEFLNRLTAITVFNDMDRTMASLILDKKIGDLRDKLAAKSISLTLTDAARELLLDEGFSPEYGGREVERVVNARLKRVLMRALINGKFKEGGEVTVDRDGDALAITAVNEFSKES